MEKYTNLYSYDKIYISKINLKSVYCLYMRKTKSESFGTVLHTS